MEKLRSFMIWVQKKGGEASLNLDNLFNYGVVTIFSGMTLLRYTGYLITLSLCLVVLTLLYLVVCLTKTLKAVIH